MSLVVRNLSLVKKGKTRLSSLSFAVSPGQRVALLGSNGAGKTLLLRSLVGLEAFQGLVSWKQDNLQNMSLKNRALTFAWSPASSTLSFSLKAQELVVMGRFPWHQGYPKLQDHKRVEEVFQALSIEDLWGRDIATLSSGEARKLELARMLASDSPCLLFDEPTSFLDPESMEILGYLLLKESAKGRAILFSCHDLLFVKTFATHVLTLNSGRLLFAGECQAAFNHHERIGLKQKYAPSSLLSLWDGIPSL